MFILVLERYFSLLASEETLERHVVSLRIIFLYIYIYIYIYIYMLFEVKVILM